MWMLSWTPTGESVHIAWKEQGATEPGPIACVWSDYAVRLPGTSLVMNAPVGAHLPKNVCAECAAIYKSLPDGPNRPIY